MTRRRYLEPPRMQQNVGYRLAPLFRPSLVCKLSAPGRRTGRWHTWPLVVLDHDDERYLVSIRGEGDRALAVRAARHGRLARRGEVEEISVVEVPVAERGPVVDGYAARYWEVPTVAATLRAPPDPVDHPAFRIVASTGSSRAERPPV
jgi:plasmid stability protein